MVGVELLAYPGQPATFIHQFVVGAGLFTVFVWYACGISLLIIGLISVYPSKVGYLGKLLQKDYVFLLLISLLLFFLRLPNVVLPEQNSDESQLLVGVATLIVDFRPWAAVDIHTNGPLTILPLTIIHYLGGALSYGSVRLFATIFYVIPTCIFLYFSFRVLFGSSSAKLLTLPCVAFFSYQNNPDFTAYNGEHLPMLLTSAVILCSVHCLSRRHFSLISLTVIGFLLGCTPYSKLQSVPIFFVIGFFCFFILIVYRQYKHIGFFLFFALLPSSVVLCYLLYTGVFHDFFESYIYTNLLYSRYGVGGEISPPLHNRLATILEIIFRNVGSLSPILTWIIVIIFSGILLTLKNGLLTIPQKTLLAFFLTTLLAAYFAVVIPGNGFDHYLILFLVPFFSTAGFITGTYILPFFDRINRYKSVFLIATVGLPFFNSVYTGNSGIAYALENPPLQPSEIAQFLIKVTEPGERVVIWGWEPSHYIEAGVIQGTREAHPYQIIFNKDQQVYYRQRYIADLDTYRARYLVEIGVSGTSDRKTLVPNTAKDFLYKENGEIALAGIYSVPVVKSYVDRHFTLFGKVNNARIYRRINQ